MLYCHEKHTCKSDFYNRSSTGKGLKIHYKIYSLHTKNELGDQRVKSEREKKT